MEKTPSSYITQEAQVWTYPSWWKEIGGNVGRLDGGPQEEQTKMEAKAMKNRE